MAQPCFEDVMKAYLQRESVIAQMEENENFERYSYGLVRIAHELDSIMSILGDLNEPDFSWCENQSDIEYTRDLHEQAVEDYRVLSDYLGEYLGTLD